MWLKNGKWGGGMEATQHFKCLSRKREKAQQPCSLATISMNALEQGNKLTIPKTVQAIF